MGEEAFPMSGGIELWTLTLLTGGLGAWLRWVILSYPKGTLQQRLLWINTVGSFFLGILSEDSGTMILGAGLLGGLTTFSTWVQGCESLPLFKKGLFVILIPIITSFGFYLGYQLSLPL